MDNGTQRNWAQIAGKAPVPVPVPQEQEYDFFTLEKQTAKYAIMLDIEFENGDCLAMPYAYLSKIKYDLSSGITIDWGGTAILIEGRNLKTLYRHLTRHKVLIIHETIDKVDDEEVDTLYITKITRIQVI